MLKNLKLDFTNMLYGLGAAVVILGALAKIQHWPYGSLLLTIGMITEAIVFAYSAFETTKDTNDNSRVIYEPYDTSEIVKAQKEYANKIQKAVENINLINKSHAAHLKLSKSSVKAYEDINKNSVSLAKNTFDINKIYQSILKVIKK